MLNDETAIGLGEYNMPTPDNHDSIKEAIWGDFTSIRIDGDNLVFINQSTNRIVGRVMLSCIEIIEDGDVWKGDI